MAVDTLSRYCTPHAARRMLRAGNIEAAMKRTDRTVLLITLNAVVAITLFPFHVVAEIFW